METILNEAGENIFWAKRIPKTNKVFFNISLLLVFTIDLLIVIISSDLMIFWVEMLIVLGIFLAFMYIENNIFAKKFKLSDSKLDGLIYGLINLRNIFLFMNCIPFIQLLGILLSFWFSIIFVPIYIILIAFRFRAVNINKNIIAL
jgi:hypothetical protein